MPEFEITESAPDWYRAYFGPNDDREPDMAPVDRPTVYVTEKTCGRCRKTLPRERFFASVGRRDGLQSVCKDCGRDLAREYYRTNAERLRPIARDRMRRIAAERKAAAVPVTS